MNYAVLRPDCCLESRHNNAETALFSGIWLLVDYFGRLNQELFLPSLSGAVVCSRGYQVT